MEIKQMETLTSYILSEDRINRDKNIRVYRQLGGHRGQFVIAGAPKRWSLICPTFIYNLDYRIAGHYNEIKTFLESVPNIEVDKILSNSYTKDNYNIPESEGGKKESFECECDDYRLYMEDLNYNFKLNKKKRIHSLEEKFKIE